MQHNKSTSFEIRKATKEDVPLILDFSTFLGRPGIYLEDLFVLEEFSGRGYGKKLLARLAVIAVERNYGRLEWAVLDWNEPSIEFYKSLGARLMNEWTVNRLTGEKLDKLATMF